MDSKKVWVYAQDGKKAMEEAKGIGEILPFNRVLLDLMHAKPQPFMDFILRTIKLQDLLDQKPGLEDVDERFTNLEYILHRLVEIGVVEKLPMRVRIRKLKGMPRKDFPTGTVREGWEKAEPRIGNRYSLYLDDGKIYRTGTIKRVRPGVFETVGSTYKLEVLDRSYPF
jgi:hypothetical protein